MNKYISNEKMTLEEGQKKRKCLIFSLFSFKNKKKNDVNKYEREMWKK
jgi:hypothetical protein